MDLLDMFLLPRRARCGANVSSLRALPDGSDCPTCAEIIGAKGKAASDHRSCCWRLDVLFPYQTQKQVWLREPFTNALYHPLPEYASRVEAFDAAPRLAASAATTTGQQPEQALKHLSVSNLVHAPAPPAAAPAHAATTASSTQGAVRAPRAAKAAMLASQAGLTGSAVSKPAKAAKPSKEREQFWQVSSQAELDSYPVVQYMRSRSSCIGWSITSEVRMEGRLHVANIAVEAA